MIEVEGGEWLVGSSVRGMGVVGLVGLCGVWCVVLKERWLVFGGLESIDVAAVESQFVRHDLVVRVCHALIHSGRAGLVRRVGVELQIDLAAAPPEDSVLSHAMPVGEPCPLRQRVLRLEGHLLLAVLLVPGSPSVFAVLPCDAADWDSGDE